MKPEELIALAKKARENSYSPYSGQKVGAALLATDGSYFLGANIENAAYSPTICAERSAFAAAVSSGKRSFSAIAICGGEKPFPPCGVCRQVMAEFCSPDFKIYVAGETVAEYTLGELLPKAFSSNCFIGE